jgi:hypothetical protein
LFQALRTIIEDGANVTIDEEFGDERAAGDGVADVIFAESAAVLLGEAVFVNPDAIRAAKLFVDEAIGRIPHGDFAAPADGNAVNFEAIVDFDALMDFAGWLEEMEVQPGRGDFLEVGGLGEEAENFGARVREEEAVVEFEEFHEGSVTRRHFMSCLERRERIDQMSSD